MPDTLLWPSYATHHHRPTHYMVTSRRETQTPRNKFMLWADALPLSPAPHKLAWRHNSPDSPCSTGRMMAGGSALASELTKDGRKPKEKCLPCRAIQSIPLPSASQGHHSCLDSAGEHVELEFPRRPKAGSDNRKIPEVRYSMFDIFPCL